MEADQIPLLVDLLRKSPSNWGKWGADDEVGCLNYLTADEVLRGVGAVRQGKVFTLQIRMCDPEGEPRLEGREPARRYMVSDKSLWLAGKGPEAPGGAQWADDMMITFLQGSTQYDALGHIWIDDKIYNGYDARSTVGGLSHASVLPLAERGVAGHGVLLDIARFRGKDVLDPGETFGKSDLLECANQQGCAVEKHDILLLRTGQMGAFYRSSSKATFFSDYTDPGLSYSPELVDWFHEREIPNLVTDTTANEVYVDPEHGTQITLHAALMRNLGVVFTEMAALDDLASDCAEDGQYTFLYTAGPLKVAEATGAPVNPIVIK